MTEENADANMKRTCCPRDYDEKKFMGMNHTTWGLIITYAFTIAGVVIAVVGLCKIPSTTARGYYTATVASTERFKLPAPHERLFTEFFICLFALCPGPLAILGSSRKRLDLLDAANYITAMVVPTLIFACQHLHDVSFNVVYAQNLNPEQKLVQSQLYFATRFAYAGLMTCFFTHLAIMSLCVINRYWIQFGRIPIDPDYSVEDEERRLINDPAYQESPGVIEKAAEAVTAPDSSSRMAYSQRA